MAKIAMLELTRRSAGAYGSALAEAREEDDAEGGDAVASLHSGPAGGGVAPLLRWAGRRGGGC